MCERCLAFAVLEKALQDYTSLKSDKFNAREFIESNDKRWNDIRKFWCKVAGIDETIFRERVKKYVRIKHGKTPMVCCDSIPIDSGAYDHV